MTDRPRRYVTTTLAGTDVWYLPGPGESIIEPCDLCTEGDCTEHPCGDPELDALADEISAAESN